MSSSVVAFSSRPQPFPASGSFPMSQLLASGGQSIGASASMSVLPMNIRDWFPLELGGLISLQSKGLSRAFSNTTVHSKASILRHSAFFIAQLSHPYMITGKTIALTRQTSVSKVMSLLFNTLSRLVIVFLPRSKRLLISWQQSPLRLKPPVGVGMSWTMLHPHPSGKHRVPSRCSVNPCRKKALDEVGR